MIFEVIAQVDATEFFLDEAGEATVNWRWCDEHATFKHTDACEFIVHAEGLSYRTDLANEMRAFGCTEAFVNAYLDAARQGAVRVLFYA